MAIGDLKWWIGPLFAAGERPINYGIEDEAT
jgi:hypothetical protein